MDHMQGDCPWLPLESEYCKGLGAGLIVLGTLGAGLNGWLISTLLLSSLLNAKTHLLTLNLALASLGRAVLAGFPFTGTSTLAGRWLFGPNCCQLFAFLRQFFSLAQLINLAVIAVERALIVKYPRIGDKLSVRIYVAGITLCWLSSVAWSIPPLTGWGRYNCDPTGMSCDLDWRPISGSQLSYNLCFLLLGGALPAMLTLASAWQAVHSKNMAAVRTERGLSHVEQHALAKAAMVLIVTFLLVWMPHALQLLWILTGKGRTLPEALAIMSPLSAEASTMVPTLVYLACPTRVRGALMGALVVTRRPIKRRPRHSIRLTEIK
ncbi:visual pigment-like receptor peropsin [Anabrus simplex]|uniref:visual pigment-like receptor peropsin n=1 Tax=Anabrus simplex TaxID=316456 RepID=UPI0034DD1E09